NQQEGCTEYGQGRLQESVRGHQVSSLVAVTLRGGDLRSVGFNRLDVHRRHRCLPSGLAPLRALTGSFASRTPGVTPARERVAGGLSGVQPGRCMAYHGREVAGGQVNGHIVWTADLDAHSHARLPLVDTDEGQTRRPRPARRAPATRRTSSIVSSSSTSRRPTISFLRFEWTLLYWHEGRSALVLDHEHQEFRRLGTARVPVDNMNIA